jgi:hypothetical protein
MDSSLRRKILNQVTAQSPALQEAQGIKESKSEPVKTDKIFEYRRQIKKIKEFETKWKEEAEDWSDEQWKKFDEAMKPQTTVGMLESMMERRELREKTEAEDKRKLRAAIFEKIDMSKIGRL